MTLSIQNNLSKRNENKSYDGDSPKLILSATFFFICSKAFAPFTVASHCLRTLQRLRCRIGESIVFRFCLSATDFVCVPCIAPTVSHYYSTETKNRNVTFTGRRRIEFFSTKWILLLLLNSWVRLCPSDHYYWNILESQSTHLRFLVQNKLNICPTSGAWTFSALFPHRILIYPDVNVIPKNTITKTTQINTKRVVRRGLFSKRITMS